MGSGPLFEADIRAAEIPDGGVAAESLEHDADLLFGTELVVDDSLDVADELFCLFGSGLSLPEPVLNLLN